MPQNYAGQTLRGRPFKPQDDLKGADFTGAILHGVNFEGLDLTDANFAYANIRSTNFANATLRNANFAGVKLGLQKRWMSAQLTFVFLLSAMLNFSLITLGGAYTAILFPPNGNIVLGALVILVLMAACFAIALQGLTTKAASTILVAFVVAFPFAFLFTSGASAGTLAFAGTGVLALAVSGMVSGAVAIASRLASVLALTITGVSIFIAIEIANSNSRLISENVTSVAASLVSAAFVGTVLLLSLYVAWQTFKGNEKFALAHSLGVVIGAIGGASFCGADLTAANFTGARLKSANFNRSKKKQTILTHIDWSKAKQLNCTRTGDSILSDPTVRDLLVQENNYKKTYIGANLYGANLNGKNLESANFKGANLSHATLQQAHLKDANLAKTLATGADFTGAYLTGTCLEAWNIDHTTSLENVDCQFVFLLQVPNSLGNRERRPHNPNKVFQPGDFEKLYRKIMTTVQILLRDGINPESFTAAFQKLMAEYPDLTPESIRSIEKKDSDVLLTLQVPATADKAKIEQQFDEVYQDSLPEQTNAALLSSKEQHIQFLEKLALKQADNKLDLSQLLSNFTIIAGEHNTMTDNHNPGITAGDGNVINTGPQTFSHSLINLSGTVTNALNGLSATDPIQSELKSLLTQLQTTIETSLDLSDLDKTDALEQVGILADLGSNPQQPQKETLGRKAITFLKGTATMLPSTATLVKAISELIPAITKLIGL